MFLKSAAEDPMAILRSVIKRPWSLALRMGLYYGVSAFLILFLTTTLLYYALRSQLEYADDLRLQGKLREVKPILVNEPLDVAALNDSVRLEYVSRSMEPVLIRIKDVDGHVIVETPGMSEALPVGSFKAWSVLGKTDEPYYLKSATGRPFRALSMQVANVSDQKKYVVHIATDHLQEQALLEHYRSHLRNVLGASIFICGMLGYLIARRGLRPLANMGATVSHIKASTLDVRVDPSGQPSELTTLALSFNDMLSRLEDAFSRISRYSADIAHELRTPLHNLRNATEVALTRARTPDEYRDVLASCLEECVRLSRLIESLMFIARAENPQTTIQREPVNVSQELEQLADFYSAAAAESGISIALHAENNVTASLDRDLFQRAVANLIENAIKYSPTGSTIDVSARIADKALQVDIADSGRGIPSEHLPRVFDRFYRVDQTRTKKTGGLGLGLAIVQTIAQLHQGKVEIQSQVGVGTKVRLIFPLTVVPHAEAAKETKPAVDKPFPAEQWAKPAQA